VAVVDCLLGNYGRDGPVALRLPFAILNTIGMLSLARVFGEFLTEQCNLTTTSGGRTFRKGSKDDDEIS